MFFFRHPKPVIDGRALVVQMVQQKASRAVSRTLLIVDDKPAAPLLPPAAAPKDEP
jgi:hypothetical protein